MDADAEQLRVSFRVHGGVIGGSTVFTFDAAHLSAADATELRRLVEQADVFTLPRWRVSPFAGLTPHSLSYDITIEHGSRRRRVQTRDRSLPARLRPLVEYLARQAWQSSPAE